jgi:hypothetical protein
MKIADLKRASELHEFRCNLMEAFERVGGAPLFVGNIANVAFGVCLDKRMVDALRAATQAEIKRRVGEVDAELRALGVEIVTMDEIE